jgi:hypothetical protein
MRKVLLGAVAALLLSIPLPVAAVSWVSTTGAMPRFGEGSAPWVLAQQKSEQAKKDAAATPVKASQAAPAKDRAAEASARTPPVDAGGTAVCTCPKP